MARTAVVTGASSGIGAATVRALRAEGWEVLAGARRTDRLEQLAAETGCSWQPLDVTDQASVDAFAAGIEQLHLLVNNAGGAKGSERVAESVDEHWRWMFEVNVLGAARMTRSLLPALRASGDGHVITIGSIAGYEAYAGGAGYNAAKFGARALMEALRLELFGEPIRLTEVAPGLVAGAEFSVVRFGGDEQRAAKVYEGTTPLQVEDVAACIAFAASRPSHVNIDLMIVKPREQASVTKVLRR